MLVLPVSDSYGESFNLTLQLCRRAVTNTNLPLLDFDVGIDCTEKAMTAVVVVVGGRRERKMRWHEDEESEMGQKLKER